MFNLRNIIGVGFNLEQQRAVSTNLYIDEEIVTRRITCKGALKRILAKKFYGHDGSLAGNKIVLSKSDLGYLTGLHDAFAEGASDERAIEALTIAISSIESAYTVSIFIE